jgi:hypothetical protein
LLEQICNYCYSIIGFSKCQGYVHTFVSDSKGNYLNQQVVRVEDHAIYWWCQADDNIEKRLRWLRRNIQDKVNELGSIHLYIWLCSEMYSQERGHHPLLSIQCMYSLVDRLNLFIEGIILCCEHLWLTMTSCGVPADD